MRSKQKKPIYMLFISLVCISTILSGCSTGKTNSPEPNTANEASPPNETQPSKNPNNGNTETNSEKLPEGVKVKKVIKDTKINNGYHKKTELLTDGGKLKTIRDSNNNIIEQYIEYEGIIMKVNGNKVEVQVKHGENRTLNIPDEIVIEDEDGVGLKQGIEIEWEVNMDGSIQSVELED